jgi:hypothetical protein
VSELRYSSSGKHHAGPLKGETNQGVKGSICPANITQAQAQQWLTQAYASDFYESDTADTPTALYQYKNGEFFKAYLSVSGDYHGFPCDFREVPSKIKRKMRDACILSKSEYKKYLG